MELNNSVFTKARISFLFECVDIKEHFATRFQLVKNLRFIRFLRVQKSSFCSKSAITFTFMQTKV